jgi:hypothetical protein
MKKILLATMLAVIAGTILVTSVTDAQGVQKTREASAYLVYEFADWLSGQPSDSNVLVLSITNSTSTSDGTLNISQLTERPTCGPFCDNLGKPSPAYAGTSGGITDDVHVKSFKTLATMTLPSGESGQLEFVFVPTPCSSPCTQSLNPPSPITILGTNWP